MIRFEVDPGTGLLQPTVRYRLGRCGVAETVRLGLVAVTGRRFQLDERHRLAGRRAVVRLRFAGRFDSSFEAHGVVRGRIRLRGRRACRIPVLAWTAQAGGAPVSEEEEEELGAVEEELEEDDCEDCEEIPADEDDVPSDGDDPDEDP